MALYVHVGTQKQSTESKVALCGVTPTFGACKSLRNRAEMEPSGSLRNVLTSAR